MADIIFLTLEEVLALYEDVMAFAGGLPGVRSMDLLEGAIAQAQAGFDERWANPFPFGMAAAYAYHLSRNHASVDGNNRVGLSAAVAFLYMNGWALNDPDETLHPIMRKERRERSRSRCVGGFLCFSTTNGE